MSGVEFNKASFESDPVAIEAPVLEFYLRYWRDKRSGNAMPLRSRLHPSEFKLHIASITLAEALSGMTDFRFRIVGTKVAQHFLADATGKTLRELYAHAATPMIEGIINLHRVPIENAKPLLIRTGAARVEGFHFAPFDVLYLPLASDAGEGAFILAAYSFPESARDGTLPSGLPILTHGAPPLLTASRS